MARRKRIHGRRRKRSPLKSMSMLARMSGAPMNGAIGPFDPQKEAVEKSKEPKSTQDASYITRNEAQNLVNRSIQGQTPAQPKENKASEAESAQKEALRTGKEPSKKHNPMSKGSLAAIGERMLKYA